MKNIVILGSTGSIGTQTLEVVRENEDLNVIGLVAGKNIELIEKQIREFNPLYACVSDEKDAEELKVKVSDLDVKIYSGMDGILEIVTMDQYDTLVTAIVGMIGIRPTVAAIKAGKTICLANKETLVTAGHIIMPLAKENNVSILPVDSEHSAIFQSLNGEPKTKIKKILLTASGGPFRNMNKSDLQNVKLEDALKHPNWSMGRKITIDSSTMINKALEVIEAKWLFNVDINDIEVYVHPQSILHSAVEFVDGAVIGQMGVPDMKLPIQYALFYPDRRPMSGNNLDLFKIGNLTFEKPDYETFVGLKLGLKAGMVGGTLPTVFNAANEKAVSLFLDRKISYTGITDIIEKCMDNHKVIDNPSLDDILETEKYIYDYISSFV